MLAFGQGLIRKSSTSQHSNECISFSVHVSLQKTDGQDFLFLSIVWS